MSSCCCGQLASSQATTSRWTSQCSCHTVGCPSHELLVGFSNETNNKIPMNSCIVTLCAPLL